MKKNRAKWVGMVCVLLGVGALVNGCPGLNIIVFSSEGLERAVRAELKLPFGFLTKADLRKVIAVDARGLEIRDLAGLEHCVNIQWLDLEDNKVSDLTPLTTLVNLTYLNLETNDVSDIQPLAGLFNLKDLRLSDNEVWDLMPLVANAENGGMGMGSVVTVGAESLLDDNNQISAAIANQIDRLEQQGVIVVMTTTATAG